MLREPVHKNPFEHQISERRHRRCHSYTSDYLVSLLLPSVVRRVDKDGTSLARHKNNMSCTCRVLEVSFGNSATDEWSLVQVGDTGDPSVTRDVSPSKVREVTHTISGTVRPYKNFGVYRPPWVSGVGSGGPRNNCQPLFQHAPRTGRRFSVNWSDVDVPDAPPTGRGQRRPRRESTSESGRVNRNTSHFGMLHFPFTNDTTRMTPGRRVVPGPLRGVPEMVGETPVKDSVSGPEVPRDSKTTETTLPLGKGRNGWSLISGLVSSTKDPSVTGPAT